MIGSPFAGTALHYVPTTPTEDRYHNELPAFADPVKVKLLARYPGNSSELDSASGDVVTADVVILVPANVSTTAKDEWTLADGERYRTLGQPRAYANPWTNDQVTQVNLRRIS